MKSILIHNFHKNGTQAIVDDFLKLGYEVFSPVNDWQGRIRYWKYNQLDSSLLDGVELINHEEFLSIRPTHILLGCAEQYNDFDVLAMEIGAKRVIHCAGNDQPLVQGEYVICPDVITFEKYQGVPKMMYFSAPTILSHRQKDIDRSFEGGVNSYVHSYSALWASGYELARRFQGEYGDCRLFGEDLILDWQEAQDMMIDSFFTLYFKPKDCWGQTVLESMWHGTPVVALRDFIKDYSLGRFLLTNDNAVIVDSVEEALHRVKTITKKEYNEMSENAKRDVRRVCNEESRLKLMREIGL